MIDAIRSFIVHHPDYLKGCVAALLCIGAWTLASMFFRFLMTAPERFRQGMEEERERLEGLNRASH